MLGPPPVVSDSNRCARRGGVTLRQQRCGCAATPPCARRQGNRDAFALHTGVAQPASRRRDVAENALVAYRFQVKFFHYVTDVTQLLSCPCFRRARLCESRHPEPPVCGPCVRLDSRLRGNDDGVGPQAAELAPAKAGNNGCVTSVMSVHALTVEVFSPATVRAPTSAPTIWTFPSASGAGTAERSPNSPSPPRRCGS